MQLTEEKQMSRAYDRGKKLHSGVVTKARQTHGIYLILHNGIPMFDRTTYITWVSMHSNILLWSVC